MSTTEVPCEGRGQLWIDADITEFAMSSVSAAAAA
jgi:hypothetical protein